MKAKAPLPATMSDIFVLDTSILVDDLRTGCHHNRIAEIDGVVRNSSVVLAELWRGATTLDDQEILESLERNYPTLTPTTNNWLESTGSTRKGAGVTISRPSLATSASLTAGAVPKSAGVHSPGAEQR